MQIQTFWDLEEAAEMVVKEALKSAVKVSATAAGLDLRCGPIYIGENFIATNCPRSLDYYGGFEYIDEGVLSIGDWKFYSDESSRVRDALETFEDDKQTQEDPS